MAAATSGTTGTTLDQAVTANNDTPRAARKNRLPAAQASADISARKTAKMPTAPSTARARGARQAAGAGDGTPHPLSAGGVFAQEERRQHDGERPLELHQHRGEA